MARGVLANTPPGKRHMKIVWRFRATAMGIWKIAKTNMPRNIGRFRPYNSSTEDYWAKGEAYTRLVAVLNT